jgi:hypothetical protein
MAWHYFQRTGQLLRPDGVVAGYGYSGKGTGKNNPDLQGIHDCGPIPVGVYRIGEPYDSPDHGPFVLPLKPDAANQMWGRSGFLLHGDSRDHPGEASEGCIIQGRVTREAVHLSGDKMLEVFAEVPLIDSPMPGSDSKDPA